MRKLKVEKIKRISQDFMSNSTGCLHSKSPLTTLDPLNMLTENKCIPTLTQYSNYICTLVKNGRTKN